MQKFRSLLTSACLALFLCAACTDSKKPTSTPLVDASSAAKTMAAPLDPACDPSYTPEQCAKLVDLLNLIKNTACNAQRTPEQCAQLNAELRNDAIRLVSELVAEEKRVEAQAQRLESGQPTAEDVADKPDECKLQSETMRALRNVLGNPKDESVSTAGRAFLALDIAQLKPKLSADCQYVPERSPESLRLKDCQLYRRAAVALRAMQPATPKDVHGKEESDAIPAKIIAIEQAITSECGIRQVADQARKMAMMKNEESRQVGMKNEDCLQQTQNLAAMRKMLNPAPGEILSQSEREALPGEIAKTEQYIAANCK